MAITILERPEGHILSPTEVEGVFSYDSGDALFTLNSGTHTFNDEWLYMVSDVENYSGFFFISGGFGPTAFKLLRDPDDVTFVQFINTGTGTYQKSVFEHTWSCVHLPITYRLENNLYPTNSADSAANINSVQDANGFTVLQLSGSPGTVHSYDFLKLTVPNDTDLSGVYQIIEFISPTVMIINLQYDAGNNFTSATAIKQYNNYTVLVRVYAGLNASHTWTAQKPYELAATLEFTPDEDNEIFFSINEILKSYIETRNNLVLGTLPNNIDFWTNFYIEIAEKYDDSDGYAFGSLTSSFTSDQGNFEGYAANAKLDFKNIHSGYLSEYLMTNNTAKFLTLFTIPVLFQCGDDTPNCYQDISFLNPYDDFELILREEYYLNGNLGTTNDISLGTPDSGVIRASISEADCDYERVDVTVLINTDAFTDNISRFVAGQTVEDFPVFIASGQTVLTVFKYSTDLTIISGVTAGDSISLTIHYVHDDGTTTLVDSGNRTTVGTTSQTNVSFPNPTKNVIAVRFTATMVDAPATGLDASIVMSLDLSSDLKAVISETKQFRIECGCSDQEIRLTWLNNLGGFDYWTFTANKDHIREIQEVVTTKNNILPNWPKSYGADADTIRKQTKRVSNKAYTIRSQFLTADEADALAYIKSSILVQIINSQTDRRTVIVDSDSFIVRKDGDDTYEVAFNISFTDDIAVQTL